jgi:NitT/TauT family transport system substrate-binding protein
MKKLQTAGEGVSFFNPADFGVNFVANSVVTAEETMADHPDQAARFTRALLAAWRDALDPKNAESALSTLKRYDRETPADVRREQLDITRTLVAHGEDGSVGRIDVAAWRQTEAIMLEQKLIPAPVSVERALILKGSSSRHERR